MSALVIEGTAEGIPAEASIDSGLSSYMRSLGVETVHARACTTPDGARGHDVRLHGRGTTIRVIAVAGDGSRLDLANVVRRAVDLWSVEAQRSALAGYAARECRCAPRFARRAVEVL